MSEIASRKNAEAEAAMPIARADLSALFDHLDLKVGLEGCDHSLRFTRAFLAGRGLAEPLVVAWLGEYGG